MHSPSSLHHCFLALLAMVLSPTTVSAQADPAKHAQGMAKIEFLQGTWGGDSFIRDENGDFQYEASIEPDDPNPNNLTIFEPTFNGNYLKVDGQLSYNFSMTIGYDQWRDKYVMVAFEDGPGIIDIYQGNFDESGNLILSNDVAGTHYLQDGIKHYNRLVFANINDSQFTWFVDISNDDGNTWDRISRFDLKK